MDNWNLKQGLLENILKLVSVSGLFTDFERIFISGSPILVTCGGKNAGKSTLNRYLINRALNK